MFALTPSEIDCGYGEAGYTIPDGVGIPVTVTNNVPTEDGEDYTLTRSFPDTPTNFVIVDNFSKAKIAPGESATFSIAPKNGLGTGTYSEMINVKGLAEAFHDEDAYFSAVLNITFEVRASTSHTPNAGGGSGSPDTGDPANITIFAVLALVSIAAIGVLILIKRKHEN